jgi:predicted exporter
VDSSLTKVYRLWERTRRLHLALWAVATALLLAVGLALKPFSIDTNIASILPDFGVDRSLDAAERRISAASSGGFYLLAASPDFETARRSAGEILAGARDHPEVESLALGFDEGTYGSFSDYLFESRYALLPDRTRRELEAGRGKRVAREALADIYGPLSIGSLDRLDLDPFALSSTAFKSFLGSGLLQGLSVAPKDGVLAAEKDGLWYVLLVGRLRGASVGTGSGGDFVPTLRALCDAEIAATPGLRVLYSGVPFHTYESSQSAQSEIAVISAVATVLVLLLTVAFFRSVVPIAATLFSLLVGIGWAVASTNLLFGEIHIFTLLFGTSLIGNAVDFAMLFFAEWKNPYEKRAGPEALRRVLGQITLGIATTLVSYFALCTAPFPLILQISAFSIFGLVGAFGTLVLVIAPIKAPRPSSPSMPLGFSSVVLRGYERLRASPLAIRAALVAALAAATVLGFSRLGVGNDIRSLYSVSPELGASEREAASVLGLASSGQYFLVRAPSDEELLQREERLCALLEEAESKGELRSHSATSMLLPSRARQEASYRLVAERLIPEAKAQMEALGFSAAEEDAFASDFASRSGRAMGPADFFALPFSGLAGSLWIGSVGDESFSAVLLSGVSDKAALRALEGEAAGTRYVDTAGDVSSVLDRYGSTAMLLLAAAYIVTFLGLWPFYGPRASAAILSAPLAASVLAAAALGLLGLPFNIFAVIGLILIVGTGVDYAIFYYDGAKHPEVTAIGIFLAMITTFISYAALAFCSFAPAKVFGWVLTVGTAASYLLAPIAARLGSRREGRAPGAF